MRQILSFLYILSKPASLLASNSFCPLCSMYMFVQLIKSLYISSKFPIQFNPLLIFSWSNNYISEPNKHLSCDKLRDTPITFSGSKQTGMPKIIVVGGKGSDELYMCLGLNRILIIIRDLVSLQRQKCSWRNGIFSIFSQQCIHIINLNLTKSREKSWTTVQSGSIFITPSDFRTIKWIFT